MKILAPAILAFGLLLPTYSIALEIDDRPDLLSELQNFEFIYPPASPEQYSGQPRSPLPYEAEYNSDRPAAISLSGLINKGDAERFIKYHEEHWFYNQIIVLDSPGGQFLEALKIGTHLQELQDPTNGGDVPTFYFLVREGDKCLSACALILAMGGGVGHALVEQGAEVGFHMGLLSDEQAESSARVRDVMNLTYDIVAEYTRLIEDGWQSPMLLREALKHRTADSFYYLRAGMRSWQMGFAPVARTGKTPQINQVGLDDGTVMRVCSALMYASSPRLPTETQFAIAGYGDFTPSLPDAATRMQDVFDQLGSNHIMRPFPHENFPMVTCSLSRNAKGDVSIGIYDSTFTANMAADPKCSSSKTVLSWCATSDAPTHPLTAPLLADALGCGGGGLLRATPEDYDNWITGWMPQAPKREGVAKRDVNIRATPGLGTSPVGTLTQGTLAEILDCAVTRDKQGVFFKIRSIQSEGWVSARFLIEEGLMSFPVTN